MKTKITTVVMLFIFIVSSTVFAIKPEPAPASKAVSKSVTKLIEKELHYPEFAIGDKFEGVVVVDLLIQNDGTFNVKAANSKDEEMKKHVIKVIEDLESEEHSQYAGQRVLIKVNFDLLQF